MKIPSTTNLFAIFLLVAVVSGCVASGGVVIEPEPAIIDNSPHHPHEVHIPPGHMPPPGQCRIWYTHRPPGHQPPPGNCRDLQRRVPANAVLVRG